MAVGVGGWNAVAGHWSQAAAERQRVLVTRAERLVSSMKDLEIGERGYALTGKEEYLDPYRAALSRLDRELVALDAADPARATAAVLAPPPADTAA